MSARASSRTSALRLVIVWLCLAHAATAFAQGGGNGTLTGTVTDSSGAAVPGATVSATEVNTGSVRTIVSNEVGLFRMAGLNPGLYAVSVELSGFKALNVADIHLLSGEIRDLGKLTLQVGAISEAIVVTSEVTPVQIATSSREGTVTSDDLKNIPMKGRDLYGLLAIVPGVQDANMSRDYGTWTSAEQITINGAPHITKNMMIDGINIVDEGGDSTGSVNPNIDAVGEIKIIANGYTAENGRNVGGTISIVTKSGTSTYKGSGWYNGRRDRFNANDYFRIVDQTPKPLYRVNIEGYSFGGPVVIPGLVDSRQKDGTKKLFFFASQEYTDDARPTTTTRSNLPTALERAGDFSQTRVTNGNIQPIIDPLTGAQFPGNIIPANRISPLGRKLLGLLPMPNNTLNQAPGQLYTQNSQFDLTPAHGRTNHVLRLDAVMSAKTRVSFRLLKDRDDTWDYNAFTPGTGYVDNNVPGIVFSSSVTRVVRPNVVNEMNFGYTHNRYGFRAADDFDYRSLYASTLGINVPRLGPFGAFSDPPALSQFGGSQVDQWPYAPRFSTGGGNRANLACYHTCDNSNEPLPRLNISARGSFQDDLSINWRRHSFKFGFYTEYDKKTEPGSANYMGNFNFGNDTNNPNNTGNGYANMLLGFYSSYTELSNRVDKDVRHWQTEAYLQDTWRPTARWTVDYGVRLTHSGADYEVNNANAGFFPDTWNASNAPRLYTLVCADGRPGNQTCPSSLQKTIDPSFPTVFLSPAFNGNIVPGTGSSANGIVSGGMPGEKTGTYFKFPFVVAAPRLGFAWNVTGDGKTALRASTGVFWNFPASSQGAGAVGYNAFVGGPPVAYSRVIRYGTFDDISQAAALGTRFVESPASPTIGGYDAPLGKSYNANVAFQRDIGFSTVAEVAYVGNWIRDAGRFVDVNRLPLYVYGNVANLFNGTSVAANNLRRIYGRYPGMGAINQFVPDLYSQTLRYNAMQLAVTRRLSKGLQMGMAYTLAKGEGYSGYDPYTDQIGGEAAIKARYWGPTSADRRHNLVVNYAYIIPSWTTMPVLKQLFSDWQVSGVTKLLSGRAVTPRCTSNNTGIANTDPSLTGLGTGAAVTATRCQLTGAPIFGGYTVDPSVPFAFQPHFNLAAFAMAQPNGSVGNFGNTPVGILRHPTWSNWDLTLARRFPISVGGRKSSGVRLQFQAYNVFNQVQFTSLDATFQFTGPNNSVLNSTTTGQYTDTTPPRQIGFTVRLDW